MSKYNKEDMIRVFEKNLDSEFKNIKFYLKHVDRLDYKKNKKEINKLIFDSIRHAAMLSSEIINLSKNDNKINENVKEAALHEEILLSELYKFELNKSEPLEIRKLLNHLIEQEKEHERIVKSLK